jgi:two-component system cell cycle sensor histidine kinase/response regulator CckA
MNPFRARLRLRLLIVALIAATPVIGAVVVSQSMARRHAQEVTLADNLRLVRLAANQQASLFNGARLLLLTLAEVPFMQTDDPRPCREMLTQVLRDHSGYLALTVANADGTLFCSTASPERIAQADASGRVWFQRAMRERTTVTGDHQLSAATGRPSIVLAHPLLDANGAVSRILAAMIDLSELKRVMSLTDLPPGGTLTLIDRFGTILARIPGDDAWVGRQVPGALPSESQALASERTNETEGVDGVRRLYITVPVRAAVATGISLSLGIDHDAVFRESDRIYRAFLWLLGIVSLLGIGAAVIGSHLFVLRPMKALKMVTNRIAAGDLSARAQLADSVAGVSELGDAVNAMAGALDMREQERDCAERELRDSEDRYRLLFAQNPHPMWVYDAATLAFLEVNDAAAHHYGYSRSEFLGMRITDIRPAEDVPRLIASLGSREPLMRSGDWRHRLKSGQNIDVEITSHTLSFDGRPAVVVTAQDITVRTLAEAALAVRATITAVLVEVGAALNRPGDLRADAQSCAEAMVAHLDLAGAQIWLQSFADDTSELAATAGDNAVGPDMAHQVNAAEWPLSVGDRIVGRMLLFPRQPFSDEIVVGMASVSALLALGVRRHQAEDARRLLASIVASSDEAIYGTTRDGVIVSWNAGAERLFGYPSDEIVGRPVILLYPPDRVGELPKLMARINHAEPVIRLETVRQRRDGSRVPVSLTLSPIKDATGKIIGTSAIARDMTEHQRTAERLDLLGRALESTNAMVSVTDTDDRFTFVNTAFLRAYGYVAEEVIGRTPALIQSTQASDEVVRAISRESRRDGWSGELMNQRRDGTELWVSLNTSAVRDGHGEIVGLLGVARDITERRSLEEQLRQSQKMEAVGQLAGGVAHDFNNLLTVIQGSASFLEESLPAPDERRADVEEIQRAAERAAALTRQLLAFSRKQILAVRVLHLGDVVAEVTPMLRRLLGESIDLRTEIGNRSLTKTDPGQLQQVIINLAVNARDAMAEGGQLTLETADVEIDEAFARLHSPIRPGPHVMLAVSDTGHGIDAATQKRIFEPFFTTKPLGQGTGLGLATVYGIVQQTGGTIWVESEVGRGTTFKVYLPKTSDAALAPPAPNAAPLPDGTESVLLVEDEGTVRQFVHRVLGRRGYNVHVEGDPVKAIEYAEAHGAAIDLILSDVILPHMNGKAMVTRLRQAHPEARVLYMSGYTDHAIVNQGVLDPDTPFLQKPFTADALARKVRHVLDTVAPVAQVMAAN